ncbi:regulatory protein RecX [Nocardioides bigeumensis]|uniref:Regulatory protein RecX n=1 Tax=Nocardioides bigeumensis TaxID=433657 RepID=A0ABN2XIT2_9ACTN
MSTTSRWQGDVSVGVDAWTRRDSTAPPPDPAAEGPDADHEAVARKILLDQLTGRARTRRELADKLSARNVPDDLAQALLDRFEEVGLVDDEAFAKAWVADRQRARGLAPRAIAQELRRKGVDDEVAREALDELTGESQAEAARTLVRRKLRSTRGLDTTVATRRLVGMLARKGYPASLAFRIVKDELGADLEDAGIDEAGLD